MKPLFSNKVFLLVMASDFLQNMGIWIRNMALLFYVVAQTNGDPVAVSMLTVAEYAPIFIFSLVGGVLADRWRPKRTMIIGDTLSFASILVILLVIQSGVWQAVFVVTVISAIVSQFSQPSSMKIFKQHVPEEHVKGAMALSQTMMSVFIIAGPMVGTAIYNWFGITASLSSLLVIFALSAIVLSFLPKSKAVTVTEKRSVLADFKEGLVFLKSQRELKILLLIFGVLALGIGLIAPLDVFLITDRLGMDKENLQWLAVSAGVGMLIGSILVGVFSIKLQGRWVVFAGLGFLAITTIVEAWSVWFGLTVSMELLNGISMAFMQTVLSAFMLSAVEERYIGRFNGLMTPVFTGAMLLGTGLSGIYMSVSSLITVYCSAGILFIIAGLIGLNLRMDAPKLDAVIEAKEKDTELNV
ncbi:MFS transporter [Aureibacillus halotolerans]|uniref:Putative MFS family arabinose efflux permease n=1 Tax=Aureibacillus halotolerans TaxID=1508390 RepID=A0A4V3D5N6_9BACI|nr:MFS transporter [Aureibacillus halotolerans]TDQ40797.1 putative MFS family arabinose efflux permease [Aureibacillus halotolerans]